MASSDVSIKSGQPSMWELIENQYGIKLPDYLIKALTCAGYDNLQSLSKLTDHHLIEELEAFASDNLDASDLGLSDTEKKFYYNRRTGNFNILPGHKHLIVATAEACSKALFQQPDTDFDSESEKVLEHHDQSSADDENPSFNGMHFLSAISPENQTPANSNKKSKAQNTVVATTIEEEEQSLIDFLKTWIARKELSGQLEPFRYDVDYKVQVYRPRSGNQLARSDIYSFVCLRCNTTIKAFKRPNGMNWNAANVCRHISTVHFLTPPSANKTKKENPSKLPFIVNNLSTPPLSDSPIEQDPLD